jgi:(1->4)-alpha-D-glucan 1-alpha-D-glucosylmutase
MEFADTKHSPGAPQTPRATYRLQFNKDFTLAQARTLVPYLSELGISHIYASPLLKAVKGSAHGYDVSDFQELNPEIGTSEDLQALHEELMRHQMGLILDIVPNHMGIDGPDNRWWLSVMTLGQKSEYARCFDIDWNPSDPRLRGKVALPILAERYNEALLCGRIQLTGKDESLHLQIGDRTLPVSPESAAFVMRRADELVKDKPRGIQAALAEVNGSNVALDEFVEKQNYRLISWRDANSVLNYRRFFTITGLAGIRIEEEWVFDQVFGLVKEWLDRGLVNGLRVDHIDGLRLPDQFLRRLRKLAPSVWIVVEKILETGESLQSRWPIDGTTGYDFLNNLNSVFIDPKGEKPLTDFYREFTGDASNFSDIVRDKKRSILNNELAAETNRLTDLLVRISAEHWEVRDCARSELRDAWTELAICLPVYRTYTEPRGNPEVSNTDARLIHQTADSARQHHSDLPAELFDFIEDLLLLRRRGKLEEDFVLRFQQLTGPVMAKAVEDTAFYCYPRFAPLNEVGGDPNQFGISALRFHQLCQEQQKAWPSSMLATATHDTKWGGDVRARLAVLSERPQQWIEAVRRWSAMNQGKRSENMPDRKIEYLFYQALVGAWPLSKDRAAAYIEKAAREAKERTGWQQRVQPYEEALRRFVTESMDDNKFMSDVENFVSQIADAGWVNSLAQTLVKMTAPGVPDFYQGSELWDLFLTDPDNRRSVDFDLRAGLLKKAKKLSAEEAWAQHESGLAKLWLIRKGLELRRRSESLGNGAKYEPLAVHGTKAGHVLAFMRARNVITIVPRLIGALDGDWKDTAIELPAGAWQNFLTETPVDGGSIASLTAHFPVALLVKGLE